PGSCPTAAPRRVPARPAGPGPGTSPAPDLTFGCLMTLGSRGRRRERRGTGAGGLPDGLGQADHLHQRAVEAHDVQRLGVALVVDPRAGVRDLLHLDPVVG